MTNQHPLKELIRLQKQNISLGIYSCCSANEIVIEAVMEKALKEDEYVLIEATANQVNQFGGYTGMTPFEFKEFVFAIARKINFPCEKVILGGDHLGPLTWKNEFAALAMEKSRELIKQYILAGFTKIHIDTSMHLGDDNCKLRLDTGLIAERGAILCQTAETAFKTLQLKQPAALEPVYIIGSEVPIPGGSQQQEDVVEVTKAIDFEITVETFKKCFIKYGLEHTWNNVIGVVVQPGVEFGDDSILAYNREAAHSLSITLKKYPNLVFEGHSTDYQTAQALKQMVEDGFAILKVGPALSFGLREGLFSLSLIENEIFKYDAEVELSDFINVMDSVMANNPENWKNHYHGDGKKVRLARKYSFSDRCRYYLPTKEVQLSINRLIANLRTVVIPLTLISQYMPVQYSKIKSNQLKNEPEALLKDRITNYIDDYIYATNPKKA